MKMKKIICAFLSLVMIASVCVGAAFSSVSADEDPVFVVSSPDDDDSNLSITKKIEVKDDGTYLTLEAYAKGLMEISEVFIPMDIALVLDLSGSMDETIQVSDGSDYSMLIPELADYYSYNRGFGSKPMRYQNGTWQYRSDALGWIDITHWYYGGGSVSVNKFSALKVYVRLFLEALAKNATENDIVHRVSIIGYASDASVRVGLTNVVTDIANPNMSSLYRAINNLSATGATRIDLGMNLAVNQLTGSSARAEAGKAIIAFTDGVPTTSNSFSTQVANAALGYSNTFKKKGGLVFAIGALTDPDDNAKNFLQYLSSNYTNVSSMTEGGRSKPVAEGFYEMIGVEGAIKDVLQKLTIAVVSSNMQANSFSLLKDELSSFYQFAKNGRGQVDYTASIIPATGENTWGTGKLTNDVTVTFTGKTVSVSGFNYVDNNNIVHYDELQKKWTGNKLAVTFKIEPDESADWVDGTHNYPTNVKASIVKNGVEIIVLEESPTVSVTRYVVTFNAGSNGTIGDKVTSISDNYAKGATYPTAPKTNPDTYYEFDYWEDAEGTTVTEFPKTVTADATYTAIFKQVSATYTVNHFKMDSNGNYPNVADATEQLSGTIGENASYTAKYTTPYSVDGVKTTAKTILADGSTVVNVYYKLPQYTVTFNQGDHGTLPTNPTVGTYYYGAAFPAAPTATPETNYEFSHWVDGNGTPIAADAFPTTVTEAATYTAVYTQTKGNVVVNYYVMDTDGKYPDVPTFTGKADEELGATYEAQGLGLDVKEFTVDAEKSTTSGTVESDGLTLNVYYTRAKHSITFDAGDHGILTDPTGAPTKELSSTDYFEGEFPTVPAPTADEHYEFEYWVDEKTGDKFGGEYGDFPTDIDGDRKFVAIYKQVSASYIVKHSFQQTDGTTYTVDPLLTETLTAELGAEVAPTPKKIAHYTVNTEKTSEKTEVKADGTLVLTVYYDLESVSVTFKSGDHGFIHGETSGKLVVTDLYGSDLTFVDPDVDMDVDTYYAFDYWVDSHGQKVNILPTTFTENETYTAVYKQVSAPYTVQHWQMDVTGEYVHITKDDESRVADLGDNGTATPKDYGEHYTMNEDKSTLEAEVIADGSLVLIVYYDLEKVTVTIKAGENGSIKDDDDGVLTYELYYGAEIPTDYEIVPATNYQFDHWENAAGETVTELPTTAEEGETYTAIFKQTNTGYTVEHYKQATDGKYYIVTDDTQKLNAEPGAPVTATPKDYGEHYTVNEKDSVLTGTAAADGSTVLKVYYDLEKVTIIFDEGENGSFVVVNGNTVKKEPFYGADFPAVPDVEPDEHFEFDYWVDSQGTKVTSFPEKALVSETYTAIYKQTSEDPGVIEPKAAAYKVLIYKQNNEGTYDLADTKILVGELGADVTYTPDSFEHYVLNTTKTVAAGKVVMPTAGDDGPVLLTLTIYYDLVEAKISFNAGEHGDFDGEDKVEIPAKYGDDFPELPVPTADEHFEFDHWEDKDGSPVTEFPETISEDMEFTAIYKQVSTDPGVIEPKAAAYKVLIYKQNNEGTYDLADTKILVGELGSTVTYTPETIENYVYNSTKSVVSSELAMPTAGDEGPVLTTLVIFYDLVEAKISFNAGEHGSFDGEDKVEIPAKYGDDFPELPVPTADEHFEFDHWEDKDGNPVTEFPETISEDMEFTAIYKQVSTDPGVIEPKAAAYKVLIYKQNNDGEYDLIDTKILVGEIGKEVTYAQIIVEHCFYNEEKSTNKGIVVMPTEGNEGPVLLTLELFYDLTETTVTFNAGDHGSFGGEKTVEKPGKYGDSFPELPTPTADEHFEFVGWADKDGKIITEFPETLTADMEFTAVYKQVSTDPSIVEPKAAAYVVEIYEEKDDGSFELVEKKVLVDEIGKTVSYDPEIPENYEINKEKSVLSGKVALPTAEGDKEPEVLTLKVYLNTKKSTITFNAGEHGTIDGEPSVTYVVKNGTAFPVPNAIPDEGFEFIGWRDETGKLVTELPKNATESHTYTAEFLAILGDSTMPAVWFMVAIVAVAGGCLSIYAKKRRKTV